MRKERAGKRCTSDSSEHANLNRVCPSSHRKIKYLIWARSISNLSLVVGSLKLCILSTIWRTRLTNFLLSSVRRMGTHCAVHSELGSFASISASITSVPQACRNLFRICNPKDCLLIFNQTFGRRQMIQAFIQHIHVLGWAMHEIQKILQHFFWKHKYQSSNQIPWIVLPQPETIHIVEKAAARCAYQLVIQFVIWQILISEREPNLSTKAFRCKPPTLHL